MSAKVAFARGPVRAPCGAPGAGRNPALMRERVILTAMSPRHQSRGSAPLIELLAQKLRPDGSGLWGFEMHESARALYRRHGFVELEHTRRITERGGSFATSEWGGRQWTCLPISRDAQPPPPGTLASFSTSTWIRSPGCSCSWRRVGSPVARTMRLRRSSRHRTRTACAGEDGIGEPIGDLDRPKSLLPTRMHDLADRRHRRRGEAGSRWP